MPKTNLRYILNRILSYYFLDFSPIERLKLWRNLLFNEVLRIKNHKLVPMQEYKIGRIFVISLIQRKDRREYVINQLKNNLINFEFFDGISHIKASEYKYLFTNSSFHNLTSGSKGCAVSHVLLWQKISEGQSNQLTLIFEDDICLADKNDISSFMKELPSDLDLLYLGSGNSRGRDISHWVSSNIVRSYNPRKGLYAYAVTPLGARKLLASCLPINIIFGGLDTRVGKIVRQEKLTAYQLIPNLISVKFDFPSDIFNPSNSRKKLYLDTLK